MPVLTVMQPPVFYAQHRHENPRWQVILIHGAGGNHLVWPAALRRLPEVAVFALDLPGHGRAGEAGQTTIEAYASTVIQFIDVLELSNVVLVGHSMGGAIAQTIAARQLPSLSALVLIGTGAKLRVSPAILQSIQLDFEEAVTTINHFAWAKETPPALQTKGRELIASTSATVLYQDFKACDQFDIRSRLANIRLPTLVISGTADNLTPAPYGRFLAEQIPQAEFKLLEGAGHMMMVEKPAETATSITQFLRQLQAKS